MIHTDAIVNVPFDYANANTEGVITALHEVGLLNVEMAARVLEAGYRFERALGLIPMECKGGCR